MKEYSNTKTVISLTVALIVGVCIGLFVTSKILKMFNGSPGIQATTNTVVVEPEQDQPIFVEGSAEISFPDRKK